MVLVPFQVICPRKTMHLPQGLEVMAEGTAVMVVVVVVMGEAMDTAIGHHMAWEVAWEVVWEVLMEADMGT